MKKKVQSYTFPVFGSILSLFILVFCTACASFDSYLETALNFMMRTRQNCKRRRRPCRSSRTPTNALCGSQAQTLSGKIITIITAIRKNTAVYTLFRRRAIPTKHTRTCTPLFLRCFRMICTASKHQKI